MKKTVMLLITVASLVGCMQDDDLYTAAPQGETMLQNTFYAKGGEEPRDSVITPPNAQETDGDPPPKVKGNNGGKPVLNDSVKLNGIKNIQQL